KLQLIGTGLVAAALAVGGCNENTSSNDMSPATVRIEASQRQIVVGEIATLVARTKDTYGREAKVRWSSTAGKLSTEQDGRVARVQFDEVGTYTVKATLSVDGREVESDMVEIRVRPVS